MKRIFFVFIIYLCTTELIFSQNIIKGQISEENGDFVIGATILVQNVEEATLGAVTDLDGYYSLDVGSRNTIVLNISYLGMETIIDTIILAIGEVKIVNYVLYAESQQLEEVKIVARQERDKVYYMENLKKKSVSTIDFISADQIKKIGDSNVSSAISRVTGVSTSNGFISVRGIGDRYVRTSINNALIPTLDPFTNNIRLDILPSNLVDNIVINKTYSPDLPGDWSAAYISIDTKNFPEKFTVNMETQVGFNSNFSFKKILNSDVSSTDWLGYDNGLRNINHNDFVVFNPSPSRYDEMVALGLGSYYNSIGVSSKWNEGSEVGETYFKLGLVELGFLGKANFDNSIEIENAKKRYNESGLRDKAYYNLNSRAAKSSLLLSDSWDTKEDLQNVNFSQSFSLGNESRFGKIVLGYVVGLKYNKNIDYDPNSKVIRTVLSEVDSLGNPLYSTFLNQKISRFGNSWNTLLSVNAKLSANHSLSLLFMPNFQGINNLRDGFDTTYSSTYPLAFTRSQFYEEKRQLIYQFKSEHFVPAWNSRFLFLASYTKGKSSAPDFKNLELFEDDLAILRFDKTLSDVRRNFRYLSENVLDAKINFERTWEKNKYGNTKLKGGLALITFNKEFSQFDYFLKFNSGKIIIDKENLNEFFTEDRFNIYKNQEGFSTVDFYYDRSTDPSNNTIGNLDVWSGYLDFDKFITSKLRIAGGLRAEYSNILSEVKEFKDLNLPRNDFRRRVPGQSFIANPVDIKRLDVMPAINLIYKLDDDDLYPFNLRFNYSRTLARPSIREYSETIMYDFELAADVFGNSDLKFVNINNFDFRFEKYFKNKDNISVSLFYKNFVNHIELISSSIGFTWTNAKSSYVYGLELEGKKNLSKNLELRANLTFVNSKTTLNNQRLQIDEGIKSWVILNQVTRQMFGQAPFVVNTILNYTLDSIGLNASISYNLQGPKLAFTSTSLAPDVFEMPRHLIDVKLSKSLNKYFSFNFLIKDVLNSPRRRAYKYAEGYLLDFDRYTFGTTYNVGISYKL